MGSMGSPGPDGTETPHTPHTPHTEPPGQPVQQLRVRRRLALEAKVLAGPDEAGAEVGLPNSVDQGAGRGGRARIHEPAREGEAIEGRAGREGMEAGRNS